MQTRQVDVAIIGGGTAAMNARRAVEKAGGTPLMIEAQQFGTTCARVGCMPSKLLIAAADAAHGVATAAHFGIDVTAGWSVDASKVMSRLRRLRDHFVGGVMEEIRALPDEQLLRGHARFAGPTTLVVDGHTRVEAKAIVVATGSQPFIPPQFEAIRDAVLVSDEVFELTQLPRSLAVIGTGIVGLELGQALARLGVTTTFFARADRLGELTDPAVRAASRDVFGQELDLRFGTRIVDAAVEKHGIRLRWRDASRDDNAALFEAVLVATGRRPNVAGLDLEAAGLRLDERGLPAWDPRTTRCGDSPIFMAGDVSGHRALLHEASDEGRIAGANAMAHPQVVAHDRRIPLSITFTDPQMAIVGEHFAQLEGEAFEVGEVSFAQQGRATVMGRAEGLLRIYGNADTCTIIGAEMFGPRAEHLAHLLAWVIQERVPVTRVLRMPVYHPVLEEGLRTALRDLARQMKLAGRCRGEDFASAAGN